MNRSQSLFVMTIKCNLIHHITQVFSLIHPQNVDRCFIRPNDSISSTWRRSIRMHLPTRLNPAQKDCVEHHPTESAQSSMLSSDRNQAPSKLFFWFDISRIFQLLLLMDKWIRCLTLLHVSYTAESNNIYKASNTVQLKPTGSAQSPISSSDSRQAPICNCLQASCGYTSVAAPDGWMNLGGWHILSVPRLPVKLLEINSDRNVGVVLELSQGNAVHLRPKWPDSV